jgi:hypothetical protein
MIEAFDDHPTDLRHETFSNDHPHARPGVAEMQHLYSLHP